MCVSCLKFQTMWDPYVRSRILHSDFSTNFARSRTISHDINWLRNAVDSAIWADILLRSRVIDILLDENTCSDETDDACVVSSMIHSTGPAYSKLKPGVRVYNRPAAIKSSELYRHWCRNTPLNARYLGQHWTRSPYGHPDTECSNLPECWAQGWLYQATGTRACVTRLVVDDDWQYTTAITND
jgi:hypothetical protein